MTGLTDISPEILHNLFTFVDAADLGRLTSTCHFLRDFITRDELLWRKSYLSRFDEPKECPVSWAEALKLLIQLEKILESSDYDMKRDRLKFVVETAFSLLMATKTSQPLRNEDFLNHHFIHDARRSNVSTFLRQSSLFRHCGLPYDEPADTIELQQLSAKLHVHFGLEAEIRHSELLEVEGARDIHPYARSRVYDLRRYKAVNQWGPFMDDGSGRVDWEKVQSVFIVLAHGLRMLCERSSGVIGPFWDSPFHGLAANSYQSVISSSSSDEEESSNAANPSHSRHSSGGSIGLPTPPSSLGNGSGPLVDWFNNAMRSEIGSASREAKFQAEQEAFALQDPYGVKGTWMRIVNFLDYHDLFAFNFTSQAPPDGEEREPVSTTEAFRLILIKLWVTRIELPEEEDDVANGDGTREVERGGGLAMRKMPIVHFAGKSRSLHIRWDPNANSQIRGSCSYSFCRGLAYRCTGYVRMSPHGDVRWTTFSVFHGEERWRSECVQIGGIKSQRGALGNWFDKDYDPHGPAGPTAFWKLNDGFEVYRNEMDDD